MQFRGRLLKGTTYILFFQSGKQFFLIAYSSLMAVEFSAQISSQIVITFGMSFVHLNFACMIFSVQCFGYESR